ncbi:MAG TPA: IPTL-CTERM sorting domain-containing protein [Thermodesulfobacteriota bacterium]|nr:IPTL-CTERM sorting domain-containing protein [Thermodesulfobacteriota bacterium]
MFDYLFKSLAVALLFFTFALSSKAEIILRNNTGNGFGNEIAFTQFPVSTPPGGPHDFEILTCTTTSTGSNFFFDPSPDVFTNLDSGSCDTTNQGMVGTCVLGLWQRALGSAGGSENTCSWNDPTRAFATASMRWSGVDFDNPIVEEECVTGFGATATAPSVNAEEGSEVVRIFNFGVSSSNLRNNTTQVQDGSIKILVIVDLEVDFQAVLLEALSFSNAAAGQTGEYQLFLPEEVGDEEAIAPWRACTITLRPEVRNVPTMSEWGLGVFAALFGIAAVWALRRRAVRA